jgi:DNA-binding response OmpR family regulator
MNDIQKSILGCVVPANGISSPENMRYLASSVDTLEFEFASWMKDGDALHSEFAESSVSSQGSNPFAEEVTNIQVFPQERPAESSTSSQGSDLFAEILEILAAPQYDDLANQVANIYALSQERPAESNMSSQDSDPFSEISKIISTSQDDGLAKQATNCHAFPQKRFAIAGKSSQDSDPSVRKKIKRTNAESSPAVAGTSSQGSEFAASLKLLSSKISPPKDADSSEAQQAHSKRICMRLNGRKLEINGRIIILGSKEFVFVKLLFEKINTYVPTDDLNVAVYGGEAGNWKKNSCEEKKRFYSLLGSLRRKLPEDWFEGKASKGYMLSDPSDPSVRKKIKRTNDADSKKACMMLDERKLEINGRIIILGSKECVFVKLLFEKINTYVPTDDLYVALYEGEVGDWKKDFCEEKKRFYSLLSNLRRKLPKDWFEGKASKGYMLSDLSVRKKIKRTNDADSKKVCIRLDGKILNINGRIIGLAPKESVFVKLLIEKINTDVPTDDLYVAVYGGEAGDWYKDSLKERQRIYPLLTILRKKLPEGCFKKSLKGYMLSGSVMTSQDSDLLAEEAAKFQSTSVVASTSSQDFPSVREEIKRTPAQNKMVYSSGIGMNIEKNELEIDGESFIFKSQNFMALKFLFERMNTYVLLDDLYVAVYGEDEACQRLLCKKKCSYKLFYPLHNKIPEGYIKCSLTMGYMLSNPNELVDVSYQGFSNAPKKTRGSDDSDSSEASESEEDGDNLQKIQYDRENSPLISDCYTDDYAQFVKDNKSTRRRYIKVRKSPGFIRIGGTDVSFRENNVTLDGGSISLDIRSAQILRLLALWYPKLVSYEQLYYNLPFGTKGDYACSGGNPEMRKHYLFGVMYHVKIKLRSVTDRICISSFKKKGYKLVCHSKRQACPNESSVQDTLHSQSTDSSS